jgi:hypothetical protein
MEGFCEHGNKPASFIKYWEIPEWVSDRRLLKMGSAPWSYFS